MRQQARQSHACVPSLSRHATRFYPLCLSVHRVSSCTLAALPLHLGCINHVSIMTLLHRHLVHAQVSKTDGCRANEQQKQTKQQKQKEQTPKQTSGRKTRVASLSPNPAGVVSVDGVEVLEPAICVRITHSPRLLERPFFACVGRTVGQVCGGQGRCEAV